MRCSDVDNELSINHAAMLEVYSIWTVMVHCCNIVYLQNGSGCNCRQIAITLTLFVNFNLRHYSHWLSWWLCVQVNDFHVCGLTRAEVASRLRDLPQRVRLVCARHQFPADDKVSVSSSASTLQRLVKAKSEQSLASTSESASLSRNKSKSLEPLSKFGIWSSEPTEVRLTKGDEGLGFSILDDPVGCCRPVMGNRLIRS